MGFQNGMARGLLAAPPGLQRRICAFYPLQQVYYTKVISRLSTENDEIRDFTPALTTGIGRCGHAASPNGSGRKRRAATACGSEVGVPQNHPGCTHYTARRRIMSPLKGRPTKPRPFRVGRNRRCGVVPTQKKKRRPPKCNAAGVPLSTAVYRFAFRGRFI